jgi:hypothetical protein
MTYSAAEALRTGRIDDTLRQPWRGQPVGTPWAATVRVELYASPVLDLSLGPLFHRAHVIRLRER